MFFKCFENFEILFHPRTGRKKPAKFPQEVETNMGHTNSKTNAYKNTSIKKQQNQ